MNTSVSLQSCDAKKEEVVRHLIDYALSHGLWTLIFTYISLFISFFIATGIMLRSADWKFDYHAPISLFPSPFPRSCYEKAMNVQTTYNELMHAVAHDKQFLYDCLQQY